MQSSLQNRSLDHNNKKITGISSTLIKKLLKNISNQSYLNRNILTCLNIIKYP